MRVGTCLPTDDSMRVDDRFSLDRALEALARTGIRGCLCNFAAEESRWEQEALELAGALQRADITLLEYNAPCWLQPQERSGCRPLAHSFARLLAIAESIGCLNVGACAGGFGRGLGPHPRNRSAESWELLKETCLLVAEEAARRNLHARVEIELVYTSVIWSPQVLARFVDEVSSPNVQGHMDIVNALHFDLIYNHSDFIGQSFQVLGRRIHSAHIKDVAPRESYLPGLEERLVGDGVLDLRTYLACLGSLPPDFPVVIEHMRAMEDIERSYRRVQAIAYELSLPLWDA